MLDRGRKERVEREGERIPHAPSLRTSELYRPLVLATLLMVIVFSTGVAGYTVIDKGHSLLKAIYMTAITLTTVGYGEIVDMTDRPGARMFTVLLLFTGAGIFVYFFSTLTSFIVEGNLERLFWRRKMAKMIDHLSGHYIVCGGGFTGRHVMRELIATERPFVLIEASEAHAEEFRQHVEADFPIVIGDATNDETLLATGIDRAKGLFTCISNDKDNLIVTVSARLLNPNLRIVCRCTDEAVEAKMRKSGADAVVSPNQIGGLRMLSEMVRPTVVSFLDVMLRDKDKRLRVEESRVVAGSKLDGVTVGELRQRAIEDLLLVALRLSDGEWIYNPRDATRLVPDMNLVYMGSPAARLAVEEIASA